MDMWSCGCDAPWPGFLAALVAPGLVYLSLEGHELVQVGIELLGAGLRGRQLRLFLHQVVTHALLHFLQLRDGGGACLGGLGDRHGHPGPLPPASLVRGAASNWKALPRASCTHDLGGLPGSEYSPCLSRCDRGGGGGKFQVGHQGPVKPSPWTAPRRQAPFEQRWEAPRVLGGPLLQRVCPHGHWDHAVVPGRRPLTSRALWQPPRLHPEPARAVWVSGAEDAVAFVHSAGGSWLVWFQSQAPSVLPQAPLSLLCLKKQPDTAALTTAPEWGAGEEALVIRMGQGGTP